MMGGKETGMRGLGPFILFININIGHVHELRRGDERVIHDSLPGLLSLVAYQPTSTIGAGRVTCNDTQPLTK